MSQQTTEQQVALNTEAINEIVANAKTGANLPDVEAEQHSTFVVVYDSAGQVIGKSPMDDFIMSAGVEIVTGGTVVDTPGTVTQRRISINLLDKNATWETGATIPINPGDNDLSSIASATKSISPLIPIKDGDYLKRVNLDTFRFVRSDGTTIVPFDDPVYNNNNRLSSIKIVFDDPSDDIAYIQVALLDTNIGVTDMLVHFRDCDTSGNPVVVPTGWDDYDVYVDDYNEWDVSRAIKEKVDGLNLFDPTNAYYAGYYQQATGVFNKSFPSTGLLPASEGEWYSINTPGNVQITFFDNSMVRTGGTVGIRAEAPANTAFVTFQLPSHTIDYYSIAVTKGKNPRSGTSRYRYRHIGIKDILDIKMNIVGDSISTEDGTYATKAYPMLIQENMNIPTLRNYAVSGQTFAYFADNYASIYNEDVDFTFVALGTNDHAFNLPLGTIADSAFRADPATYPNSVFGDMGKLYHQMVSGNDKTKFGFIGPIQRDGYVQNALGLYLYDYVDAIKEFCEHFSIPFFDGYRGIGLTPRRTDIKADFYVSGDGIHPNDDGHLEFMYPRLLGFFKSIVADDFS